MKPNLTLKMKPLLISILLVISSATFAQKAPSTQTSNLNSSKSNLYRIVYSPALISDAIASSIGKELDQQGTLDSAALKTWLAANFKRLGVDPRRVKQISFLDERQFKDCTICKQNCKGRCVQDPGADCVCFQHSEPNLRMAKPESGRTVIVLSESILNSATALEAAATSVKSGKSNSSD